MSVIFVLIAFSSFVAIMFLAAYIWSVKPVSMMIVIHRQLEFYLIMKPRSTNQMKIIKNSTYVIYILLFSN